MAKANSQPLPWLVAASRLAPSTHRRLFWLFIFAVAMAQLEASVVVYLRALYYPEGFAFPIKVIPGHIAWVEIARESATLVMILSVAWLTTRDPWRRFAAFLFIFAVWDIFYYAWLWVMLAWPPSLFTEDILFLTPMPWVGPVWAPVAVSTGMIWAGVVILARNEQERPLDLNRRFMLLEVAAGFTIIVSFLIPGRAVIDQTIPEHFPWYLFLIGLGSGLGAFGWKLRFTEKEEII